MIIDIIKMGLIDTIRNIKKLFIFVLVIAALGISVFAAWKSLKYTIDAARNSRLSYTVITLGTDMKKLSGVDKPLDRIFKKGGYTFIYANALLGETSCQGYVLIGKYITDSDDNYVLMLSENEMNYLPKDKAGEFSVVSQDRINTEALSLVGLDGLITQANMKIVSFSNEEYKHLSSHVSTATGLTEVLENTQFSEKDIKEGLQEEFESLFSNDSPICVRRGSNYYPTEIRFIYMFVGVYSGLVLVVTIISFIIFIKDYYKKMREEYVINMIYGATTITILVRNLVFVFVFAILEIVVLWRQSVYLNNPISIVVIYTAFVAFVMVIVSAILLKKEKLDVNKET